MPDRQRQILPKTEHHEMKLACLRVGSAFYALNILGIREIIRPTTVTAVPRSPFYVDGVITLRKAVIPVVDLRRRFGIEVQKQPRERIVICAVDGRIIGLQVDEVTEVASFSTQDIQPAPYYMSGDKSDFFPGVCRYKGQIMLLLDLRKILASEEKIDMEQLQPECFEETLKV